MNPTQGSPITSLAEKNIEQFPPIAATPVSTTVEKTNDMSQKISRKESDKKIKADEADFDLRATRKDLLQKVIDQRKILEETTKEKDRVIQELADARIQFETNLDVVSAEKKQVLEDLQKTQLQLKVLDTVQEELARVKKQFEEIKSNTETESKTTLVSKEIKQAKEKLTDLHAELVKNIHIVTNAVLKKEVPENYSKEEQKIYSDASQTLSDKTQIYKTISEQLKNSKEAS